VRHVSSEQGGRPGKVGVTRVMSYDAIMIRLVYDFSWLVLGFLYAAHHAKPVGHALNLSAAHAAYPVIVQTKKFGYAPRIHRFVGRIRMYGGYRT